ncbi:MAG: hypothetical protein U9R75_08245 [Candidatus Thermoplasmatota archaeon]|nr:hypothetical protein [Candidatus Thermoplasmatota archaeon]
MEKNEEEGLAITLKVKQSKISSVGSGVARMHSSHLDCFEETDHDMVVIKKEGRSIVVKLVSDRLAQQNVLIMREGDMEDLKVKEGDEVTIEPYHKITKEIKERWDKFISRFKKNEEEENEE